MVLLVSFFVLIEDKAKSEYAIQYLPLPQTQSISVWFEFFLLCVPFK